MRGALSLPECPLRCSCTPTQWVLTAAVCPDFVRADGGRVPSAVLKMIQNGADPNGNYLGVSPLSMLPSTRRRPKILYGIFGGDGCQATISSVARRP